MFFQTGDSGSPCMGFARVRLHNIGAVAALAWGLCVHEQLCKAGHARGCEREGTQNIDLSTSVAMPALGTAL